MTKQKIFSNTEFVNVSQSSENGDGVDLTLKLTGEASNANDLSNVFSQSYAENGSGDASSAGLYKTILGTRNLDEIFIDSSADATDGANFAWGFFSVLLEGERNLNPVDVRLFASGSSVLSADPTEGEDPNIGNPDPAYGMDNSTTYLSDFGDYIYIDSSATAGDWVNQAVAYGVRGGNAKVDKRPLPDAYTNLKGLRDSIFTYGGDDHLDILVTAENSGSEFEVPTAAAQELAGRQRAVGVFQAIVDLGDGNDLFTSRTFTTIGSNPTRGAESIAGQSDFFGGNQSQMQDSSVAGAVDIYESALILGSGDDVAELHNGWNSDIWLDSGDDSIELVAGKELFIHGGDGYDTAIFESSSNYLGTDNDLHVIQTSEGNVYLDVEVEKLVIDGEAIFDVGGGDSYVPINTENTINGTSGNDKIKGRKSNDLVYGYEGNDKLIGKSGDDLLDGGMDNDNLNGSKGDDYLLGGPGLDTLIGGKGADVFKTSKGIDMVNDFNLKQGDRVGLNQGTEYEVISDVEGTLIRVSDDIRMLLLNQDYEEFLAAGTDAIARIAV